MKVSLLSQACDTVKSTKNYVDQISRTVTSVNNQLDFRIKGNVESRLRQIKNDLSSINSETDRIVNALKNVIDSAKSIEKTAKREANNNSGRSVTVPVTELFSQGIETYEDSTIDMSDVDLYEQNNAIVDNLTHEIENCLDEIAKNPDSAVGNQKKIEGIMQKIFSMGISQEDLKKMIPTNYQKTLGFIVLSDDEIKALEQMGYSSLFSDYTRGYIPYTEYENLICQNEDFKNAYDFLNSLNIDENDKRRIMGMLLNGVNITKDGIDFKYSGVSANDYAMYKGLVNNYLVSNYDQETIKKYVKSILCNKISDESKNELLDKYVNSTLETSGIDAIFDLHIDNDTLRELVPTSKQEELGVVILSSEEQAYLKSKGINNLENLGVKLKNGKVYYLTTAQHEQIIAENTSIGSVPSALSEIGGADNTASVSSNYNYINNIENGFKVTYGNPTYNFSDYEILQFYAIVYAEAAATQDDALAVASAILNRYDDGETIYKSGGGWTDGRTNSLSNIFSASDQFETYNGSTYNSVMNGSIVVPDYVKNAVNDALSGVRNNKFDSWRSNSSTWYGDLMITSSGNRFKIAGWGKDKSAYKTYAAEASASATQTAEVAPVTTTVETPVVEEKPVATPPAAVTEVTTDSIAATASVSNDELSLVNQSAANFGFSPVTELSYDGYYNVSSNPLYKSMGVWENNVHKETYYSTWKLYGPGLNIPGRHVAKDGTIRDKDGYIVIAYNDAPKGTVMMTSLGPGKVYDTGGMSSSKWIDVYVAWNKTDWNESTDLEFNQFYEELIASGSIPEGWDKKWSTDAKVEYVRNLYNQSHGTGE